MGRLSGKIALVTGASRGIGRGIAERLAADGAEVIVNYHRSEAAAQDVIDTIIRSGGKAVALGADISDLAQVDALFGRVSAQHPRLDILVNNAGRGSGGMPTLDQSSPEHFEQMFGLNTRGLFFVTQAAVRLMPDGGRIINLSSTVTLARVGGLSIYAGSKAAVEAFTRIWAAELARRQITVNAILPGMVATDLILDNMPPDAMEKAARSAPMGRIGLPGDIADVVAFLASKDGGWINGQCLTVNGGA